MKYENKNIIQREKSFAANKNIFKNKYLNISMIIDSIIFFIILYQSKLHILNNLKFFLLLFYIY